MATPENPFDFVFGGVTLTTFYAGWSENGCDVFDIIKTHNDEFVDSLVVTPAHSIEDNIEAWKATHHYFLEDGVLV